MKVVGSTKELEKIRWGLEEGGNKKKRGKVRPVVGGAVLVAPGYQHQLLVAMRRVSGPPILFRAPTRGTVLAAPDAFKKLGEDVK